MGLKFSQSINQSINQSFVQSISQSQNTCLYQQMIKRFT